MHHAICNFSLPNPYFDNWWIALVEKIAGCSADVLLTAVEKDGKTYRRVIFQRGDESVLGESMPGPRDRPDLFLVSISLPKPTNQFGRETTVPLWVEMETVFVEIGGQNVYRADWAKGVQNRTCS